VPPVRAHVLYCATGTCTCFELCQRYVHMFCIVPPVRGHVLHCATGTCTCFALCHRYVHMFLLCHRYVHMFLLCHRYVHMFLLCHLYVYMFCIVPPVRAHVLHCVTSTCTCFYCATSTCTCFYCATGTCTCFYCATGMCTCFVLCHRYVYMFCIVPPVRAHVLCCASVTPEKSFKNFALRYLLFYVHPQVTKPKLWTVCVTWCCIDNVTK